MVLINTNKTYNLPWITFNATSPIFRWPFSYQGFCLFPRFWGYFISRIFCISRTFFYPIHMMDRVAMMEATIPAWLNVNSFVISGFWRISAIVKWYLLALKVTKALCLIHWFEKKLQHFYQIISVIYCLQNISQNI